MRIPSWFSLFLVVLLAGLHPLAWAEADDHPTLTVVAEGLSDANFYKDRRVAYDEALKDAKRQVLDKAVGAFVDSRTRIENYQLISDTLETRYQGFIKRLVKVVDGGPQADGFYHVWIKAEVYTEPLAKSMAKFTKAERRRLIRAHGNPTFAVKIDVISDENDRIIQRCDVCETEIADRMTRFGFKLVDWDWAQEQIRKRKELMRIEQGDLEAARYGVGKQPVDILVTGQVKLHRNAPVEVAGMKVRTVSLTSWAVKAIATQTSEVIFSRNFRPHRAAFNDEDQAILAVGRKAGRLFSKEVFKDYVASPTRTLTLSIFGLSTRRIAQDLKRDMLAARSIVGARFKDYIRGAEAVFEVDYVGTREEFANFLENEMLTALNRKYGKGTFAIIRESGDLVEVKVIKPENVTRERINKGPTLAMTVATPQRARQVIKSQETLAKVAAYNDDLPTQLDDL